MESRQSGTASRCARAIETTPAVSGCVCWRVGTSKLMAALSLAAVMVTDASRTRDDTQHASRVKVEVSVLGVILARLDTAQSAVPSDTAEGVTVLHVYTGSSSYLLDKNSWTLSGRGSLHGLIAAANIHACKCSGLAHTRPAGRIVDNVQISIVLHWYGNCLYAYSLTNIKCCLTGNSCVVSLMTSHTKWSHY